VVLDTNVLISALLFKGELTRMVGIWQSGKMIPIISKQTFNELRAVLEYPKFSLSRAEIMGMTSLFPVPSRQTLIASSPGTKIYPIQKNINL
jgi:putative PIN family toxin of toxin-antitoxin system